MLQSKRSTMYTRHINKRRKIRPSQSSQIIVSAKIILTCRSFFLIFSGPLHPMWCRSRIRLPVKISVYFGRLGLTHRFSVTNFPKPSCKRQHVCPVPECGKIFSSPFNLRSHLVVHTGAMRQWYLLTDSYAISEF